ncbi:MAG TPA: DUF4097 family beta strand repeat-containing protein [Clostridia bacterium]|nr:DUF4097 family beta strand repeat-containing protein [Clostridia bacterium]
MQLNSVAGSIRISGSMRDLTVNSVSGSVDLVLTEKAKADIDTVSGDVTLTVPDVSASRFSFDSLSGKQYSDLAIAGDGGIVDYTINSISGNLTIRECRPE